MEKIYILEDGPSNFPALSLTSVVVDVIPTSGNAAVIPIEAVCARLEPRFRCGGSGSATVATKELHYVESSHHLGVGSLVGRCLLPTTAGSAKRGPRRPT